MSVLTLFCDHHEYVGRLDEQCFELTQNGEPISKIFSMRTFVAFPTVRGTGLAKVVEEPPAVPVF